jgi:hypothetical protein
MPLSRYNPLVTSNKGKQAGSAAEVKASFIKQYGQQEGTRRFYAWVNSRRKSKGMTRSVPAPGSKLSQQLRGK